MGVRGLEYIRLRFNCAGPMIQPPGPLRTIRGMAWLTKWLNQLREYCLSLNIVSAHNIQVRRTSQGFALLGMPGEEGTIGSTLGVFKLQSVQDHYVTAFQYFPADQSNGTTPVYLAKSPKLSTVAFSDTVLGEFHRYTFGDGPDTDNKYRFDTVTDITERQLVIPPWVVNEMIYGIQGQTGTVGPSGELLEWLIISPDRQWAATMAQTGLGG